VLIHQFRDGNGCLALVLSSLMALQAGLDKHYAQMESLFGEVIGQSHTSYTA
jgi:Fic family protein